MPSLYRLGEDGVIEAVKVAPTTEQHMLSLPPDRREAAIKSYMDKAMSKTAVHQPTESKAYSAFVSRLSTMRCLNCLDDGCITLPIRTNHGVYNFAFQCQCQFKAEKPYGGRALENITSLTQRRLYTMHCRMGGDDGLFCPLTAKTEKCCNFRCPKFDGRS